MRRRLAELLFRTAAKLYAADITNKEKAMGFQPPSAHSVPISYIVNLKARFGLWAYYNGAAQVGAVGVFVKDDGSPDFTLIGKPILLNFDPAAMKAYIDETYKNDERAFLRGEFEAAANKQLDDYFRANYAWEQAAGSAVLSDAEIDALPSGYDELNATLAKFGTIMVDADKKTIQFYA